MDPTKPARPSALLCGALTALLLAWNGSLAHYANPFVMTQHNDGTQDYLLVRNRFHGHHEVGDTSHTVREEGAHPIWRPGLVFMEEVLARAHAVRGAAVLTMAERLLNQQTQASNSCRTLPSPPTDRGRPSRSRMTVVGSNPSR